MKMAWRPLTDARLYRVSRICKIVAVGLTGWILGGLAAFVGLVAFAVTAGRARPWIRASLTRPLCLLVMRISGLRLVIDERLPLPLEGAVYISNHTTAADIFATAALCLPRTRYFLSNATLLYLPMTALALLGGVFYLPYQTDPVGRRRVFRRAAQVLRNSGDSVFLTPEGQRVTTGTIARFNKGAFHMALDLGRPVVSMYTELRDTAGNRTYDLWSKGTVTITIFAVERFAGPCTPERIESVRKIHEDAYHRFEAGERTQSQAASERCNTSSLLSALSV